MRGGADPLAVRGDLSPAAGEGELRPGAQAGIPRSAAVFIQFTRRENPAGIRGHSAKRRSEGSSSVRIEKKWWRRRESNPTSVLKMLNLLILGISVLQEMQ